MNPDDTNNLTPEVPVPESPKRFPVATQISVLAGFLLFLFALAGATLPKFVTSLRNVATIPSEGSPAATHELPPVASGPLAVASEISLTAEAAYVFDPLSQRVLYEKNSDQVLPLASITKLMTALVAYELVNGDTAVTIPGQAAAQESASGLSPGDRYRTSRLSTLALLSSSNDAAYALATAVGSRLGEAEPTAQFVTAMNIRAGELGLSSLSFKNTTGLDISTTEAGAYGNAKDVSQLLYYTVSNHPDLVAPTTVTKKRVYDEGGDFRDAENTNPLVNEIPNLLASKTGYTDLAGGNLTIAFDNGFGHPIIVTVLGSTHQGRFADVKALVEEIQIGAIQ